MLAKALLRPSGLVRACVRGFNLHEYQSIEHMHTFNIPTPKSQVASSAEEAERVAQSIGQEVVVKAQVLAGGRGKGHFVPSKFQGGVHLCNLSQVKHIASQMIGQSLVTKQTGSSGKPCNKVMVAEKVALKKELYLAFLLDRQSGGAAVVCSPHGGMDIEEVARSTPEHIHTFGVANGVSREVSDTIAETLSLANKEEFFSIVTNLYNCFMQSDLLQLEINPLGVTTDDRVLICDAKLNIDDNAKFRQKALHEKVDMTQEDPIELDAHQFDLNYISLDGNIGCLVNGAGLAMATMDLIKFKGSSPANFLDVGGSANEEQIMNALRILSANEKVESILLNIFGGIMRCDIIARGLVSAVKKLGLSKPIVARLCGTNWETAKELIQAESIPVIYEQDAEEAVRKAVGLAQLMRQADDLGISLTIR